MVCAQQPLTAGLARLCSTCVNDELTLVVFPTVSFNTKPPVTDSAGELGLAGDDGELHLLSLMLPLQLSRLNTTINISGTMEINIQSIWQQTSQALKWLKLILNCTEILFLLNDVNEQNHVTMLQTSMNSKLVRKKQKQLTISHDVKQPKAHSHDRASEVHQQPTDCGLQSQWMSQTASEQKLHALGQPAARLYSDLVHNIISNK